MISMGVIASFIWPEAEEGEEGEEESDSTVSTASTLDLDELKSTPRQSSRRSFL